MTERPGVELPQLIVPGHGKAPRRAPIVSWLSRMTPRSTVSIMRIVVRSLWLVQQSAIVNVKRLWSRLQTLIDCSYCAAFCWLRDSRMGALTATTGARRQRLTTQQSTVSPMYDLWHRLSAVNKVVRHLTAWHRQYPLTAEQQLSYTCSDYVGFKNMNDFMRLYEVYSPCTADNTDNIAAMNRQTDRQKKVSNVVAF